MNEQTNQRLLTTHKFQLQSSGFRHPVVLEDDTYIRGTCRTHLQGWKTFSPSWGRHDREV